MVFAVIVLIVLLVLCLIGAVAGLIVWKKGGSLKERIKQRMEQQLQKQGGTTLGGTSQGGTTEGAATDDARQAEAMSYMEKIAATLETYKATNGSYPSPGHNQDSYYSIVDLSQIKDMLALPEISQDPWGNPYDYGISQDSQSYVLICKGSDGVSKLEKIPDSLVETHCYQDEIVLENGNFVQKPAGPQKDCGG